MTQFKAGQRVRVTLEGKVRAGYADPTDAFGIDLDESEDDWAYFEGLPEGAVEAVLPPLPTEHGIYVPANNTFDGAPFPSTYIYILNSAGWHLYDGHQVVAHTGGASERAEKAHQNLGGLVRLVVDK